MFQIVYSMFWVAHTTKTPECLTVGVFIIRYLKDSQHWKIISNKVGLCYYKIHIKLFSCILYSWNGTSII